MNPKSKGTKLFFSQFGGEQPIPQEFIAAMNRREEVQSVPNDVGPEALSDEIIESGVKTDRTNERKRTTVKKKPGNIVLRGTRTNDQGQPVQVTRTLMPTSFALNNPGIPTGTQSISDSDLGNGWTIREVGEEGTYVGDPPVFTPGVFPANIFSRERPNLIPEEFRPTIPTVTSRIESLGTAVDPTLSGTKLREEQRQVTDFKKSVEISTQAAPSLPVTLDKGRDTNQAKQDVVVTRKLIADATTADTATVLKEVQVKQLGDGNKIQETREVSSVFAESEYVAEVPDVVPEKFRVAIPTTESGSVVTGTAGVPSLGTGDLRKSEKQVTVFTKLQRLLTRAGISLPVSLIGKETNQAKQVVTVTETYKNAGTDATPDAVTDVIVQNMGDGRVVETTKVVPSVFAEELIGKERPDSLPQKFRAAFPSRIEETTAAGTASEPTLDVNQVSGEERQINDFVKRTRVVARPDISLPSSLGGGKLIEEFGGGTAAVNETVDVIGSLSTDSGLMVVESEVENLGDGRGHKTTVTGPGDSWPVLHGADVDEQLGIEIPFTQQVVAESATAPTDGITTLRPIDKYRTQKISKPVPNSTLDSYVLSFPGETNVDFPPELVGITGIAESASSGVGYYSDNGSYSIAGNGSGGINLHGEAQGSAGVITDATYELTQPYGRDIPCTNYLFFVASGTTRAQIITKLKGSTFKNDGSLHDFPDFDPKQVTIFCRGEKIDGKLVMDASAHDTIRTDYLGVVQYPYGSIRSIGAGGHFDIVVDIKAIRIPNVIHRTITPTVSGSLTQAVSAAGSIGNGINGGSFSLVTVYATGSFSYVGLTATDGFTHYDDLAGNYVVRIVCEPYKKGYVKVLAQVVNANDLN